MEKTQKQTLRNMSHGERAAFFGAFLGWIFDYYEIFLLTFLVVPISQELNLTATQSAALFTVDLASLAVGGIIFGVLADRLGRRDILLVTVLIYSAATLARAAVPNYWLLMLLTAVAGAGLGGEYGVGQALISEVLHARRRGWWSGILYSGAFYAIMLAALVGGYVLPAVGWRLTFIISGLPVLIVFYIRLRAPESPAWSRAVQLEKRGGARAYARPSFIVPFLKCFVAAGLYFWAYYGVTTLLPTHLVSLGFSMSKASWWIFFTAVSGLIGCWFGAHFADRWGRRPTISVLMALSVIGGAVLYLVGNTLLTTALIFVPFFVLYFGSNGATVFGSLFSEAFPTEIRSTGVNASLQIARGSAGIPPLLAAAVIPAFGYGVVFLGGAILYAAAGAWIWIFAETKGMEVTHIDQTARETTIAGGTGNLEGQVP